MVYDPVNDEIWHTNPEAQAVLAFRGGANGEEPPVRIIQGPHTMMAFPNYGVGVDAVNNEVYVVEKEYITVYPRTAKGDVAPTRIIRGPDTGLQNARAILVDTTRNLLLVGTNNGIVIFDRTASGNAKPRAILAGAAVRSQGHAFTARQRFRHPLGCRERGLQIRQHGFSRPKHGHEQKILRPAR